MKKQTEYARIGMEGLIACTAMLGVMLYRVDKGSTNIKALLMSIDIISPAIDFVADPRSSPKTLKKVYRAEGFGLDVISSIFQVHFKWL